MSHKPNCQLPFEAGARARQSQGTSGSVIYEVVCALIRKRHPGGGVLLDVGCGTGELWRRVRDRFERYIAADLIQYEGISQDGQFHQVDLDRSPLPLSSCSVDVAVSIETIEHLENPRAFVRELARVLRSGGHLFVTTPNQLSLLSKLTLITKNQFNAFQEAPGLYPSHLTALLEIDLLRVARESELENAQVHYTDRGRVPFTERNWPSFCGGRLFSDNVILSAQKPDDEREPANRSAGVTASIYADHS